MSHTLRATLEAEGGLLAGALGPADPPGEDDLVVAAVREGQRLHVGAPVLLTEADDDLALLAGDRLYALGLERLAAEGDLATVGALADVISACAQALADGDPACAESAWERFASRRTDARA
jgi:hypothetical protein